MRKEVLLLVLLAVIFIIGCQDIKGINVEASKKADYNQDGCVNENDFGIFQAYYDDQDLLADLNNDGNVDFSDFVLFAQSTNKPCDASAKENLDSDKILLITLIEPKGSLDYNGADPKILGTTLKPHPTDKNKYLFYVLTTPNYPKLEFIIATHIVVDGEVFVHQSEFGFTLAYEKSTNEFFGEPLKKESSLYVGEFDYTLLDDKGEHFIFLYPYNSDGTPYIGTFDTPRLRFEIVNPEDPPISDSCDLIYASKYDDAVNIAFIGDSYSQSELLTYAYDVERSVNAFLSDPTIIPYKNRINVYRANYEGDLECRRGNDCLSYTNALGLDKLMGESERAFCCNSEKTKSIVKSLCGDMNYVTNVITNNDASGGAVFHFPNRFLQFFTVVQWPELFRNYVLGKKEDGITVQTRRDRDTFSHEIGHLVAGLPDYYESDPECKIHPCKMCDMSPYSDVQSCYDKQGMVRWLNQWCKADVKILNNPRVSPYPNPFNPVKGQNTTVEFSLSYDLGEDPCYVLMNVYNINGQLVDMVVSENALPAGVYSLKWDGKTFDQIQVASGVYIYEINVGDNKDTVKGTVLK